MRSVLCVAAIALSGFAQSTPNVSTRAVVAAAGAYVREYQQQLTSVVADEIYIQDIVVQIPRDPSGPRTRVMEGEVFFMFVPQGGWMTIRDVTRVDRQPAAERLDVPQVLRDKSVREAARTFTAHNARYNIGHTFRNFNEPTLALLVLDEQHRARFSFDRRRVERSADGTVVVLSFRERERPTLIHHLHEGPVYSRGELTIDAATGRVLRTTLSAQTGDIRLELTTEYGDDERLQMAVPVKFRERYERGKRPRGLTPETEGRFSEEYEEIVCDATYMKYRRFETQVRIR